MESVHNMTYVFELFGVAVFAATGCIAGGRKQMDLFGVLVVGLVTALGGGTLRDLILDAPVAWLGDNNYLFVAIGAVLSTFVLVRFRKIPAGFLLVLDALGLALFTVQGVEKALGLGTTVFLAVMMGAMTGTAGGVIRDVLCNDVPYIFKSRDLYATPALAGATAFAAMERTGVGTPVPLLLGFAITLGIRLASLRWDLSLPKYRDSLPDSTED